MNRDEIARQVSGCSLDDILVIDDFFSEDLRQDLLGQLDSADRGNASSAVTFNFRIPLDVYGRVHAIACRNTKPPDPSHSAEQGLCVKVPGQIGVHGDVSWHQDVTDTGERLIGFVALVYLKGAGTLVFRRQDVEDTQDVHVDVLPGRMVTWCNTTFRHKLDAHSHERVMLGPVAVNSANFLCRGGSPMASFGIGVENRVRVKRLDPAQEDANIICEVLTLGHESECRVKSTKKLQLGRYETVDKFRERIEEFGVDFFNAPLELPDGRVLTYEDGETRLASLLGLFVQVVTLSCSKEEVPISISCTGMSGDELAKLSFESKETVSRFKERLAEILDLSTSELALVVEDGRMLSASDGELLVREVFGLAGVAEAECAVENASRSDRCCAIV